MEAKKKGYYEAHEPKKIRLIDGYGFSTGYNFLGIR